MFAVSVSVFALLPQAQLRAPVSRSLRAPVSVRSSAPSLTSDEQLLSLIDGTDRGVAATPERRAEIGSLIEELEASWCGTDAFAAEQQPLLLRRTEVAYVGQSDSARANAAGGKYRGRIGRLVFQTTALFQHVLEDNVAVNVIQFRLLGLIPGAAVLPGTWTQASAEEREQLRRGSSRALTPNTVRVQFRPPRVCFGRTGALMTLQMGPETSVGLDTTYLSDALRICRGAGSGVPFVFRADTCADGAPLAAASKQWSACVARRPLGKRPLVLAALAGAAALASRALGSALPRWTALPLVAVAVALLRSTGGIVVS